MYQSFVIQGRLDGLNEYTNANRASRYGGAAMKKRNQQKVEETIEAYGLKPFAKPVNIKVWWFEKPNRGKMRDQDNVFFAIKFILDALVAKGIIEDDDWEHVKSISNYGLRATGEARIEVLLEEAEHE